MGLKPNQNQTRQFGEASSSSSMSAAMIKRKKRHGHGHVAGHGAGEEPLAEQEHVDAEVIRVETAFTPVKPVRKYHQKRWKKPEAESSAPQEDESSGPPIASTTTSAPTTTSSAATRRKLKVRKAKDPPEPSENQPPNHHHDAYLHQPTQTQTCSAPSSSLPGEVLPARSHKRKNPKSALHRTEMFRTRKPEESEGDDSSNSPSSCVSEASCCSPAPPTNTSAKDKENLQVMATSSTASARRRKREKADQLHSTEQPQAHPNQHKHKHPRKFDKSAPAPTTTTTIDITACSTHPSHKPAPTSSPSPLPPTAATPSKTAPAPLKKKKYISKKNRASFRPLEVWKAKVPVNPAPTQQTETPDTGARNTKDQEHQQEDDDDLTYDNTGEEAEDPEVDEERQFADDKRRSLKQGSNVFFRKSREIQRCTKSVQCEAFPAESSSQETQSGSEYECLTVHPFDVVAGPPPSSATTMVDEQGHNLEMVSHFPLEWLAAPWTHSNVNWMVHEILLENFEFRPSYLQVEAGDVVVWRVSEQTMGMVEHCLSIDATLIGENGLLQLDQRLNVMSPLLSGGSVFALRFGKCCRVEVHCTVYQLSGALEVIPKRVAAHRMMHHPEEHRPESPMAQVMEHDQCEVAPMEAVTTESTVEETDLSAAFILVGEVLCPYAVEKTDSEEQETQEPVAKEDEAALTPMDFQDQIIQMLKKSEESQLIKRQSFVVAEGSGFDAARAYDFFKRRFAQLQLEDRALVYCKCPEMVRREWM